MRAGIYKEYYKNGNLKVDYLYTATGHQDGNQTEYRMNGYKKHQRIYKVGKLIGSKIWRADGTQDPILKRF
jgi:antitoxin component YwqK of YwqJK toxin-antitoxin module